MIESVANNVLKNWLKIANCAWRTNVTELSTLDWFKEIFPPTMIQQRGGKHIPARLLKMCCGSNSFSSNWIILDNKYLLKTAFLQTLSRHRNPRPLHSFWAIFVWQSRSYSCWTCIDRNAIYLIIFIFK